jgi:hypothetical protein
VNVPERVAEAEGARPPVTDAVPVAVLVSVPLVGPVALPPTVQVKDAVGWPPATASSSSSVRVIITSISGISGSFRVQCVHVWASA